MKVTGYSLVRLLVAAVFTLGLFASPAFAKKGDEQLPPYDVNGLTHAKVWVPWTFAFLFAAGGIAAAFKNPHRSTVERT